MLDNYTVYLASNSPRRRELLTLLGIDFSRPVSVDIEETYPAELETEKVPEYLARLKANAYLPLMRKGDLYITADTVVILDNKVLGKPDNNEEAFRMLRALSNRVHTVVTGVCVTTLEQTEQFSATTEVEFGDLTDEEITDYIRDCHPLDKAGAYGIQERIGAIGVKGIKGSYYNVMGLPVHRLYQILKKF